MTFAQLMALATTTVELVATKNAQFRALATETATTNATATTLATSIANHEASILPLASRVGEIDRSIVTLIICLENTIGATESAIERFAADIPPLYATIGEVDTKVNAVRQDLNRHVDDVAALKPIVNSVRYDQLGAIREHIRRVELKSGAAYTVVSDSITWLKTMFFEGLDKVNIRVDDLLCTPPSHPTLPGALPAPARQSPGIPPNPEGASAPNNALASPGSEVRGDGPPLAGRLGSGRAPPVRHPLYPTACDFEYTQEAAVHGRLDPRVNARPQGRNWTDTGRQGSGFTPRSHHLRHPGGEGLAYDRLPRAHGSRDAMAPPDRRRYDNEVDAEYGHWDEDSLPQGGAIISSRHWDCRQEAQSAHTAYRQ